MLSLNTPRRRALGLVGALAATALAVSVAAGSASADPVTPGAPKPATAAAPAAATLSRQLQKLLDAVAVAGVPAAVATVRSGRSTWAGAAGKADLGTGRAARPADRFRVGSATKAFTATVVLQLVAEHKLKLTDTVEHLLPGLLPQGRRVTVRDLLGMRSGLASYTDVLFADPSAVLTNRYRTWTPKHLVALIAAKPLNFTPGTKFEYSNTNYILLGMIVEKVTGRSFTTQLQRRILRPLHLRSTSLPTTYTKITGSALHGYLSLDSTKPPLDFTRQNPSWAWTAGGMISTTGDLAAFWRAQLAGKLLPPALLKRALTDTVKDGQASYGLGVEITPTPCGAAYGHAGDIPAYSTRIYTTRDGAHQVVVAQSQLAQQNTEKQDAALGAFIATALCGSAG